MRSDVLQAQLVPKLSWRRPWSDLRDAKEPVRLEPRAGGWALVLPAWDALKAWEPITVPAGDAYRLLVTLRPDRPESCKAFVEQYGPFTPPASSADASHTGECEIDVAEWLRIQAAFLAVEHSRVQAATVFSHFHAIDDHNKPIHLPKSTEEKSRLLVERIAGAEIFAGAAEARFRLRVSFTAQRTRKSPVSTLVAEPVDLLSLLWVTVAGQLTYSGRYKWRCRNTQCEEWIEGTPKKWTEGTSKKVAPIHLYHDPRPGSRCAVAVHRHPEWDRYPEMRGLKGQRGLLKAWEIVTRPGVGVRVDE